MVVALKMNVSLQLIVRKRCGLMAKSFDAISCFPLSLECYKLFLHI